jgi:hypothetical protein
MDKTPTEDNRPPPRRIEMKPKKRVRSRLTLENGDKMRPKKLDFGEKKPWRPIQVYTEGFDYIKVELAGCQCATKQERCHQDVCECPTEKITDQLQCGCRVEPCKPWQSAQEMF